MPNLAKPAFFIRGNFRLPVGLKLPSRKFWEGWESVPFSDVRGLGTRVERCGWLLVADAERFLKGGLGETPQEATARALKLALLQVSQSYNAARVEYLRVQEYPWFCVSTVAVYPHAIKPGAAFPAEPAPRRGAVL